jgi:hypothetical protein
MSLPNACLRLVATLCAGRTASAMAAGLMRALRRMAMAALALLACISKTKHSLNAVATLKGNL